jgi:prolipoprotein diacylglyceryl transferase
MSGHFVWHMDPVLLSLGPLQVRWYGVLFAAGFLIGYQIMTWVFDREEKPFADLEVLFVYMFAGTVIGARLGHCFFYRAEHFLTHPWEIFMVWQGGLASHGSAIGMLLALYIYSRRHTDQPYLWLLSRMSLTIPSGGALIRLGNFFNSEILGTPSQVPWAVVFAQVDHQPRHPSMLYESFAYLCTWLLLMWLYKKNGPTTRPGLLLGTLFTAVFSARFVIEFFKETHATFEQTLPLHMGQLLSIPFVIVGVLLIVGKRNKAATD